MARKRRGAGTIEGEVARRIDEAAGSFALRNGRVPRALIDAAAMDGLGEGEIAAIDLVVERGRIAAIAPAESLEGAGIDLRGAQLWPAFADVHTHLDKTYIGFRSPNLKGSLLGAVEATRRDYRHWTPDDLRTRAGFALNCAFVHGTAAMRSHIDSLGPQADMSWRVLAEFRADWRRRVELQLVAMVPVEFYLDGGAENFVARTARNDGILGAVVRGGIDGGRLQPSLDALFRFAASAGLEVDLHVDENLDASATTLPHAAAAALRHGMGERVTCGHCCSLASMPEDQCERTLDLCAQAGIRLVALPLINTFLQDRTQGRTPRLRGLPPLIEIAARDIPVALASDNCGDPFHPYGDYDLLEVLREATRAAHLDSALPQWAAGVTVIPARIMGHETSIRVGAAADMIVFSARTMEELLRRPQPDRIVIRKGRRVAESLPPYSALDALCRN